MKPSRMSEEPVRSLTITVRVDPAPEENGPDFDAWCDKYDFTPLESERRAWCSSFMTYLRDAIGVAITNSGETFLLSPMDLVTTEKSQ